MHINLLGNSFMIYSLLFGMTGLTACKTVETDYLLVGTYTDSGSKGIYVFTFDESNGKVVAESNTENVVNPSFLAATDGYVYAVNETGGDTPGGLSAFSFNKNTGKLAFLNKEQTDGDAPCYVTVNGDKKWAITANYSGGSLTAFPIKPDGSLSPYAQLIQHEGSGPNKERQEKPHVHSVVFSPDGKYILSADLGLDKIFIYAFDASASEPLQATGAFDLPPGSGPRHITFSPKGKFAYVVRELDGMVSVLQYEAGGLEFVQEIPTHPEGNRLKMDGAEIKVSPDGKFLYTSNRGDENAIAIFSIDQDSGKLTRVGYQSTLGKNPRNFLIDPSGKYLLAANQDSDNIIVFKRNAETGLLEKTGEEIAVPKPVFLRIVAK